MHYRVKLDVRRGKREKNDRKLYFTHFKCEVPIRHTLGEVEQSGWKAYMGLRQESRSESAERGWCKLGRQSFPFQKWVQLSAIILLLLWVIWPRPRTGKESENKNEQTRPAAHTDCPSLHPSAQPTFFSPFIPNAPFFDKLRTMGHISHPHASITSTHTPNNIDFLIILIVATLSIWASSLR